MNRISLSWLIVGEDEPSMTSSSIAFSYRLIHRSDTTPGPFGLLQEQPRSNIIVQDAPRMFFHLFSKNKH